MPRPVRRQTATLTTTTESLLTRKGQVTVPVVVRDHLHLRRGDRVSFTIAQGKVQLTRGESVVKRTAGVFKGSLPALPAEQLRARAEELIAQDALRRSGGE